MINEEKIKEAIKYAEATTKIEDMNLQKEELEQLKEALINNSEKYLDSVIKNVKDKKDDKIK